MFKRMKGALGALMNRQPGARLFTVAAPSEAGISVSDDAAMRFSTVHACVRVLSEDVAALPLHVYRRTETGGKERAHEHPLYELLHDRPNPEMTAVSFKQALMVNALLAGNGYAFIEFDGAGRVRALYPMMAGEVTPYRSRSGEVRYRVGGEDLSSAEVFHLAGLGFDGLVGLSPIAYARESIGLGMAAERYGEKFFRNGTHIGGVISVKDELTDEQFERVRQQFAGAFRGLQNAHGVPVLEGGATYTPVGIAPEDAQFLETRKFQRNEIAAIYRVPPHMIGDLERATFSNIEQQDLAYLQRGLLPWLMRLEQEARAKLFSPAERAVYSAEHDTGNFMRGETLTRMQAYSTAIMAGIMTPNEARQRENLNPLPGGDDIMLPLNMVKGSDDGGDGADFDGGGRRRSVGGAKDAARAGAGWRGYIRRAEPLGARLERLGVTRADYERMERAFSEWLAWQAKALTEALERDRDGRSGRAEAEVRKVNKAERLRLLRLLNAFYDEMTASAAEETHWREIQSAAEAIAREAWEQIEGDPDVSGTLGEKWRAEFIRRYSGSAANRLFSANRAELERALKRADGSADGDAYAALIARLGDWMSGQRGRERSAAMARNELTLVRNEALIAGYRTMGFQSVWVAESGCCQACRRLNGQTVTTLKPPLHNGCMCSIRKGEKIDNIPLQSWSNGDTIPTEESVREWIQSPNCVKKVSAQQQNAHREGTKQYKDYVNRLKKNNQFGPSRMNPYWTDARIQKFVMERSGTGMIEVKDGRWDEKETLALEPGTDDELEDFGIAVGLETGKEGSTRLIKVHYGKDRLHVVPDYPNRMAKYLADKKRREQEDG